ncbi:MAG: rRNA maturation RNase YbeY [Edaphobacter sp.]
MITIEPPANTSNPALSTSSLTRFLNRVRLAVGLRSQVDVLLTTDSTLRQLNKNFRGKNKPTDVLSFPAPPEFAKKHAGDLAISLDTAARQATAYGHTLADEVKILLLHGLLHLSGEDHETDNGEMAAREAALRLKLNLPATLIERTTRTTIKAHTKSSPRLKKKSPPRPKAAHSAAAAERSPHSACAAATSSRKTTSKRGGQ